MDFGGYVLILEFLLFVLGVPIIFFVVRFLTKVTPKTDVLVILHDTKRTNGKAIGNLISIKEGYEGRMYIKFLSRDTKKPEIIDIVVEPNKIKAHAKGTLSSEKTILEIFPEDAVSYITKFANDIEIKNAESSIIYAQKEGLKRQQQHLFDMGEAEISAVNMSLKQDFVENTLKNATEDKRVSKNSFVTGPKDIFTG